MDVDIIGEYQADNALSCHTDKPGCCRIIRIGEWYFPNGSIVQTLGMNTFLTDYFYRNRGESTVLLNRRHDPLERGHFYCQLPDATGAVQTLSVNICE